MTDSDNSHPQDDSDEDIYKDIPEFNFEDELAKLEGSKETYKQEVSDLAETVKALTEENKELKKSNEVLKKNLSTLLKTAQAEVQRKDSLIEELRSKVESFTFRRSRKSTSDKFTSTQDLIQSWEVKPEAEKGKSESEGIKSKSHENRTSSDSERILKHEERRTKSQTGKKENSNCDNDKKSGYYRGNAQNTNFRHSERTRDAHREKHKERKSAQYEESSSRRRPFRDSHRDHLPYDTFDKRRHSRSSDNRFLSRRRSSRERGRDDRRSDSRERRKRSHGRSESSDKSRKQDKKAERSRSRGSHDSAHDKPRSRSSIDNETAGGRTKGGGSGVENKNLEKKRNEGEGVTGKDKKEKSSCKRKSKEIFETKSPLDALYEDMVACRSSNRYSNSKPGAGESDFEEGEIEKDSAEVSQEKEDWTLSFKNERPNETKPMTLYSRRMMQKFSSEPKKTEGKEEKSTKNEKEAGESAKKSEKEPGELTDDENLIESSKEFQELTKVAAIETEIIDKPVLEPLKESVAEIDTTEMNDLTKDIQKEPKQPDAKDEPITCKDTIKADVIEFSPFKNNYKLIEISPTKSTEKEHVLDFYTKKGVAAEENIPNPLEKEQEKDWEGKPSDTSGEKDSWKNSSSETELKIVVPPLRETSKESENTLKSKESEKKKEKSSSGKEETNPSKGTRKSDLKKETEAVSVERTRKRKRGFSETDEKKPKKPEVEPPRKRTRSQRNCKNEAEENDKQEMEVKSVDKKEVKEDISSFEFFKPIATAEPPEPAAEVAKTDFKMTATMSLTGVVRLETPNKCVGKLKNLIIDVLDPKNHSQFSPLVGSKCIEMTPRRMLKNDLMLTDSEDDSLIKQNAGGEDVEEEEEGDVSGSEYSDYDSDSGASDFVDLL